MIVSGDGYCNSNGNLLLRKRAEHDLPITNTAVCLPNRNKTSWMYPRSAHRNIIDYVIVRRTDRYIFRVTKTMCCADFWTNHRLVVRKLELRIRQPARRPQGKKAPERLDVPRLNQDSMGQAFNNGICNHLGAMNPRRGLVSFFSKYGSFFSCKYPRTSVSQTPRLV